MTTPDQNFVNLVFPQPDAKILTQAKAFQEVADSFTVTSQPEYDFADADLKRIIALGKDVESRRTAITIPMNTQLRAVNDFFRDPIEFLKNAEKILRSKMLAFITEQERKDREAQQLVDQAARDMVKLAEEKVRAAESAAKPAAPAFPDTFAGDEDWPAIAPAAPTPQLAAAQATLAAVKSVPAPIVTSSIKIGRGTSVRKTWSAKVVDKKALILFVAANLDMYSELLDVNQTVLNDFARIREINLNIDGTTPEQTAGLVVRSKK